MKTQSDFSEEELKNKLRILDNAIEVVNSNRKQNLLLQSNEIIRTGEYYKIDTQPKRVSCSKCFKDLSETMLRKHVAEECTSNEITCPAIGCKMIMCASDLKKHLADDCQVTKKRRWLAKQSKVRVIEERKKKAEEDERRYLSRKKAPASRRVPPAEADAPAASPRPSSREAEAARVQEKGIDDEAGAQLPPAVDDADAAALAVSIYCILE
jgi:hypothetical protein